MLSRSLSTVKMSYNFYKEHQKESEMKQRRKKTRSEGRKEKQRVIGGSWSTEEFGVFITNGGNHCPS